MCANFLHCFVLQHQAILLCLRVTFSDQLVVHCPANLPVNKRASTAGFDGSVPKPGFDLGLSFLEVLTCASCGFLQHIGSTDVLDFCSSIFCC